MITFSTDEAYYLVGRAFALLARPTCLLLGNRLFGNGAAASVASAFLIVAVLNIVSGVDPHRSFYARRFGPAPVDATRAFARYFFAHVLLGTAGAAVCVACFGLAYGMVGLAFAGALLFVTDRLSDESLRFMLFQRHRGTWGRAMMTRVVCQAALLGIVALVRPSVEPAAWIVAALGLGNLVAFGRLLPSRLIRRSLAHPRRIRNYARSAATLITRSGALWLLSLATAFGTYLERLIVLASRKDDLAIFTLIVTSMSVVQIGVDYFYFSQRRREFLEGVIDARHALLSRSYFLVVGGALLCGTLLMSINLYLYKGAPAIPLLAILLVALIQVAVGSTSIVREIAYWNNQIRAILRVELFFFAMVVGIFGSLALLNISYVWLLAAAAVTLSVRLFLLMRIDPRRLPIT
jgi:hypothetical protein